MLQKIRDDIAVLDPENEMTLTIRLPISGSKYYIYLVYMYDKWMMRLSLHKAYDHKGKVLSFDIYTTNEGDGIEAKKSLRGGRFYYSGTMVKIQEYEILVARYISYQF